MDLHVTEKYDRIPKKEGGLHHVPESAIQQHYNKDHMENHEWSDAMCISGTDRTLLPGLRRYESIKSIAERRCDHKHSLSPAHSLCGVTV